MKRWAILLCLLGAAQVAQGAVTLPCEYDGTVLRDDSGGVAQLNNLAMDRRAVHKVDLTVKDKQWDVSVEFVLRVLVDRQGRVVCVKTFRGWPVLQQSVEMAVRQWTFEPIKQKSEEVAYVGLLYFRLCNLPCGAAGPSMTLLK